jgi:hypothetical protein
LTLFSLMSVIRTRRIFDRFPYISWS